MWPSGAERATCSVPSMPPAPGLFSTRKVPPVALPNLSASRRATVSVAPPGAKVTTMRMGPLGKPLVCAINCGAARPAPSAEAVCSNWRRVADGLVARVRTVIGWLLGQQGDNNRTGTARLVISVCAAVLAAQFADVTGAIHGAVCGARASAAPIDWMHAVQRLGFDVGLPPFIEGLVPTLGFALEDSLIIDVPTGTCEVICVEHV